MRETLERRLWLLSYQLAERHEAYVAERRFIRASLAALALALLTALGVA